MLALELVDVTLHNDEPVAQDTAKELGCPGRFPEVVVLRDQHFCQGLRAGEAECLRVEKSSDEDEAIVGDLGDPIELLLADGSLDPSQGMTYHGIATLYNGVISSPWTALVNEKRMTTTFGVGRCRRGLRKNG
jgi:hypothetical protein